MQVKKRSRLNKLAFMLESYLKLWQAFFSDTLSGNAHLLPYRGSHLLIAVINRFLPKHKRINAFRFFNKSCVIKTKDGTFYCRRKREDITMVSPAFEPRLQQHFNLKHGTFIDIGACIGRYTVKVANKLGKNGTVVAIEPEPENYGMLKKNIAINKLDNVLPLNLACYSKQARLPLRVEPAKTGWHTLLHISRSIPRKQCVVQADTLDNLAKKHKLKNVKLIKIDVEGAEPDVLEGARELLKREAPAVLFEAWNDQYLAQSAKLLEPLGYRIRQIDGGNYLAEVPR